MTDEEIAKLLLEGKSCHNCLLEEMCVVFSIDVVCNTWKANSNYNLEKELRSMNVKI